MASKKKVGRPKMKKADRRHRMIAFRVTQSEHDDIMMWADKIGSEAGTEIRRLILLKARAAFIPKKDKA